jgi:predicted ATPase
MIGDREIPTWQMSDGTVRFLALTSLPYLNADYCFFIEEPENGLHPRAIQDLYDALSSVFDGQIFIASHSPLLLSCSKLEHVISFKRDHKSITTISKGDAIVDLKDWKENLSIGDLFINGILDE